jgi:hypothetical protein
MRGSGDIASFKYPPAQNRCVRFLLTAAPRFARTGTSRHGVCSFVAAELDDISLQAYLVRGQGFHG